MTKTTGMPTSPESVTPEWLTEVLRSTVAIDQTTVKSLQVELLNVEAGYVGQLARLSIHYTQSAQSAPTSLIAKFPSANPEVRAAFRGLYEREIHFYQELAEQAHMPIPRCYYSGMDPETGYSILLLEDLAHLRTIDLATGCSLVEAELVIRHLAQFHAYWWDSSLLQSKSYLASFADGAEFWQERFQGWWPGFPKKLETLFLDYRLPPSFLELGYRFGPNLARIVVQLAQTPITLVHNDVHLDNLFFGTGEGDPPLRAIDWQVAGRGRGVSDVTYFVVSSVPIALRRQAESNLLQTYHDSLIQHGVHGYDFGQCWADYRRAFFRCLSDHLASKHVGCITSSRTSTTPGCGTALGCL
jgi:hypothetical protein